MNNRLRILLIFLGGIGVALLALWFGLEFIYKGTITINGTGQSPSVTITKSDGTIVSTGQLTSYRLEPGTYTVAVTTTSGGMSKQVTVAPLSTATITMQKNVLLHTSLIAQVAMYQAFPAGDSYIGFDPSDAKVKRIDRLGNITGQLGQQAFNNPNPEADLPEVATSYQPYQHNQALVVSNGQLFVVGADGSKEINTTGIPIAASSQDAPDFVVATQPQLASFIVGYKQDVYWFANPDSAPKKIYTAKNEFDTLVYGKDHIGLYDSRIPPSVENLRALYANHQIDLLIVDTAHNNQESTVTGPITNASFNSDGTLATVSDRQQNSFIYNLQTNQKGASIATSLAGPYWTAPTTYVYAVGDNVWKYDTSQAESSLIGTTPKNVTSFYQDDAGNLIVTTYNDAENAGIYQVGAPTAASTLSDALKAALPFNDGDVDITYTNVGTPTVVVHTNAPLNDASELDRFKQQTAQMRQHALQYLTDHHIDPASVTIMYDPSD